MHRPEGNFESGFHFEGGPKKNCLIQSCLARNKNNGTKPDTYQNKTEPNKGVKFGSGFWLHGDAKVVDCF